MLVIHGRPRNKGTRPKSSVRLETHLKRAGHSGAEDLIAIAKALRGPSGRFGSAYGRFGGMY